MKTQLWLAASALLVGLWVPASGQESLMPESLAPMGYRGGTGLLLFDLDRSFLGFPEQAEETFGTDLVAGLSLRRTVQVQRQDLFGQRALDLPLFYLFRRQDTTDVNFSLSERTSMAFMDRREENLSFAGELRGYTAYRGFGLQHAIGSGPGAFTLALQRGVREQMSGPGAPVQRFTEQSMSLAGTAGSLGHLTLAFASVTPEDKALTATRTYQASLVQNLRAGEAKLAWMHQDATTGSVAARTNQADLVLPLAVRGGAARFEYHKLMTAAEGGPATGTRSLAFSTPLDVLMPGATFAWTRSLDLKAGVATHGRSLAFATPLDWFAKGAAFSYQRSAQESGGVIVAGEHNVTLALPLDQYLKGASFAYSRAEQIKGGVVVTGTKSTTFGAPLGWLAEGASLAYSDVTKTTNGAAVRDRSTVIAAPLTRLLPGSTATYKLLDHEEGGVTSHQRAWVLGGPLSLLGRQLSWNYTDQVTTVQGAQVHQDSWVWGVPFEKQTVTLARTHISPFDAEGRPGAEQWIDVLSMPPVAVLTDRLRAGYSQTVTRTEGADAVRVTAWTTQAQPLEGLTVAGQVQDTEAGPDKFARTAQVKADYAVRPNLSLNWRFLESRQVGMGPAVQRYVGLQHKLEAGVPLQMRVGFTTYDAPAGTPEDTAVAAQLAAGNESKTALTASYMEFDENNLGLLPDKTVSMALTHQLTDHFGLRLEYQDQAGRPAPMRGISVATAMLGGKMTLGHKTNPPDPRDPKQVRLADQWDAELTRKLGQLDLALSYRYCDFERAGKGVEQYMAVSLAGGQPDDGGQLKLTYLSGDFVPQPQGRPAPGSSLELSYNRRWGDKAEVTLMLRRDTAPFGMPAPEGTTEGRLEFKALW
ncbi:MAG: hypothetical protein N2512_02320 [Armatimonadetes bacterium]|nr:hypothetical protein [Armatimonadota bacterium]